jgi:hypothetical protein
MVLDHCGKLLMPGIIRSQNIINLSAGSGGGNTGFPNRPANYTNATSIDFSQAPVSSGNDQIDRAIAGATGWNMIFFLNNGTDFPGQPNWSKISDSSAIQSPPDVWRGHMPKGTWAPDTGHGMGNVFSRVMAGTTKVYVSMRALFEFPDGASNWHPISNKFLYVPTDGETHAILMQLVEGGNWRHAEELHPAGNFYVDNGIDAPGEDHIPGQIANPPVPTNEWVHFEIIIDLVGGVYRIWQNGVLTTDASPSFRSTSISMVEFTAFRGGGGETLTADIYYRYDHILVAWP